MYIEKFYFPNYFLRINPQFHLSLNNRLEPKYSKNILEFITYPEQSFQFLQRPQQRCNKK